MEEKPENITSTDKPQLIHSTKDSIIENVFDYFNYTKRLLGESLGHLPAITNDEDLNKAVKKLSISSKNIEILFYSIRKLAEEIDHLRSSFDSVKEAIVHLTEGESDKNELTEQTSGFLEIFNNQSMYIVSMTTAFKVMEGNLHNLLYCVLKDNNFNAQDVVYARVYLDSLLGQEASYQKYDPHSSERIKYNGKVEAARKEYDEHIRTFYAKQTYLEVNQIEILASLISFLKTIIKSLYNGDGAKIPEYTHIYRHNPKTFNK